MIIVNRNKNEDREMDKLRYVVFIPPSLAMVEFRVAHLIA